MHTCAMMWEITRSTSAGMNWGSSSRLLAMRGSASAPFSWCSERCREKTWKEQERDKERQERETKGKSKQKLNHKHHHQKIKNHCIWNIYNYKKIIWVNHLRTDTKNSSSKRISVKEILMKGLKIRNDGIVIYSTEGKTTSSFEREMWYWRPWML